MAVAAATAGASEREVAAEIAAAPAVVLCDEITSSLDVSVQAAVARLIDELQGGVGTLAAIRQGGAADDFINREPTDLQALTMHAAAFTFVIELQGVTRHMSKREQAVDAIMAACDLAPRLNAMTFSDAPDEAQRSINRVHVGVLHGALGRDLHEWRPPQVADVVRIKGSGRYGPGQSEAHALADLRKACDARRAGAARARRADRLRAESRRCRWRRA